MKLFILFFFLFCFAWVVGTAFRLQEPAGPEQARPPISSGRRHTQNINYLAKGRRGHAAVSSIMIGPAQQN
jgi:hypothetical protein